MNGALVDAGISTPKEWTRAALTRNGFAGWIRWSDCPAGLSAIDRASGGVYLIFRDVQLEPAFLERSPAGVFRGDPTVIRAALDANWVPQASVVYIGKAAHCRLRTRLEEFIDFGRGGKRRHWGGRLIWQLEGAEDLLVAWRVLAHLARPEEEEVRLIAAFKSAYGKRPFANNPDRLGD